MRVVIDRLGRWLDSHHVHCTPAQLIALMILAAGLGIGALVGLASIAGYTTVAHVFTRIDWPWLLGAVGAIVAAVIGYFFAYRGVFRVTCGAVLESRPMWAVVLAGFSGFLSQTAALDAHAVRAAGAEVRQSHVCVSALAGLEQGVLALGGCAASIAVVVAGLTTPGFSFTLPWAIAPLPGFVVAFWLAGRYHDRFAADQTGWRGRVAIFLDCINAVRQLFRRPLTYDAAVPGMALFWAAEAAVVWLALAAFGFRMGVAPLIVGYATGMLFTRRTVPLGGAGLLMVVLPLSLWACGAPLATAIVAVFAYRVLTLWLPLPFALAGLPTLRELLDRAITTSAAVAAIADRRAPATS